MPGTVISPATAKNVISVGAIESARGLTNGIVVTNIVTDDLGMTVTNVSTNQLFFGATDSDNQVASFSSRGNIAPGLEGTFGRFKPDVVAPGSFIISARSKDWTDPTAFEDVQLSTLSDQVVAAGSSKTDLIFVPDNARELLIRAGAECSFRISISIAADSGQTGECARPRMPSICVEQTK